MLRILLMCATALVTIQMNPNVMDILKKKSKNGSETFEFIIPEDDYKHHQCQIRSFLMTFYYLSTQICPTDYNPMCDDPIFDPFQSIEYRCQSNMINNDVIVTNTTGLTELFRVKDPRGRSWCMITMIYADNCPFSEKLAPSFNLLPSLYKNLLVVAVDAAQFSKLYFRYGVSGTPTVLFWVNGVGVSRMSNNVLNLTGLNGFIRSVSDLIPQKREGIKDLLNDDRVIEDSGIFTKGLHIKMDENRTADNYYTFFCFLVCAAAFTYQIREIILLRVSVFHWIRSRVGSTRCDNIYFLFYLEPLRIVPEREPENSDLPPLIVDN